MDFGAVMIAACVSGALTTLLMGLHANYRIVLALGDGTELLLCFYSVRSYNSGGLGYSW